MDYFPVELTYGVIFDGSTNLFDHSSTWAGKYFTVQLVLVNYFMKLYVLHSYFGNFIWTFYQELYLIIVISLLYLPCCLGWKQTNVGNILSVHVFFVLAWKKNKITGTLFIHALASQKFSLKHLIFQYIVTTCLKFLVPLS